MQVALEEPFYPLPEPVQVIASYDFLQIRTPYPSHVLAFIICFPLMQATKVDNYDSTIMFVSWRVE